MSLCGQRGCLETKLWDGRPKFIIEDMEKLFTRHPCLTLTIDKKEPGYQDLVAFSFSDFGKCFGSVAMGTNAFPLRD